MWPQSMDMERETEEKEDAAWPVNEYPGEKPGDISNSESETDDEVEETDGQGFPRLVAGIAAAVADYDYD